MSSEKLTLSFGVELEGVALKVAGSRRDLPNNYRDLLKMIADSLTAKTFPSRAYHKYFERPYNKPDYSVWGVTQDNSIYETTSGSEAAEDPKAQNDRKGFELVSPAFLFDDIDKWKKNIQDVVTAVGEIVEWKANRSCGLHVHVGPGLKSETFKLDHLKKIAMLCCRFEDAIDQLHENHRRGNNSVFGASNRRTAMLGKNINEVYEEIEKAQNVEEILYIFQFSGQNLHNIVDESSSFWKVNFLSVKDKGTIEFRQHAGTTDPEVVKQWVLFLTQFVRLADEASFDVVKGKGESLEDFKTFMGLT